MQYSRICEVLFERERAFCCPPSDMPDAEIETLLADCFFEIGASGMIHRNRADALEVLRRRRRTSEQFEISAYETHLLADSVYLCVYELAQGTRHTIRSTVWRFEDNAWRAVFHQGTLLPAARLKCATNGNAVISFVFVIIVLNVLV